jgi:hypothetical protein
MDRLILRVDTPINRIESNHHKNARVNQYNTIQYNTGNSIMFKCVRCAMKAACIHGINVLYFQCTLLNCPSVDV